MKDESNGKFRLTPFAVIAVAIGLMARGVCMAADDAPVPKTPVGVWAFNKDGKAVSIRKLNEDGTYYEANYRANPEDGSVILNNVSDVNPPSYSWKLKDGIVSLYTVDRPQPLASYTIKDGKLVDEADGMVAVRMETADIPRSLLRRKRLIYKKGETAWFGGREVTVGDDLYQYSFGSVPDILPDDPKTPLLQFYEARRDPPSKNKKGSDAKPGFHIDTNKPLLTVRAVHDVILSPDGKGVVLYLNDDDSEVYSVLTKKYLNQFMVLLATEDTGSVMHITGRVTDGYISFEDPVKTNIATYLRRRFHLGEFKTNVIR